MGAWQLTSVTPFGDSQSAVTFMADGSDPFTDRPSQPGRRLPRYLHQHRSRCLAYDRVQHRYSHRRRADNRRWGNILAVVSNSFEMTLGFTGNFLNGQFTSTSTDPSGTVLFVDGGTVPGRRITAQPLATPVASPTT